MIFSFVGAALYDIMEHSGKTAWRVIAARIDDWRVHRMFEKAVKIPKWKEDVLKEAAENFGRCIR